MNFNYKTAEFFKNLTIVKFKYAHWYKSIIDYNKGDKKMKKYLPIFILGILIVMPIVGSYEISSEINKEISEPLKISLEEQTHTVMVEFATLTTCPPCVTASDQLKSIYNSGDFDFYFVSIVSDHSNYNLNGRLLDLGVTSVPHVFFDGEYRNIIGGQSSETPYRNALTQASQRDVLDIDINVNAEWNGNGAIKINVDVINNEAEEYNGLLRVYIVEKESRWDDFGGKPYNFAAIAMPIDRSLALPKSGVKSMGETYSFSKTWRGSIFGFADITQDNTMIIASVFDKDSGYSVQAAATQPTTASGKLFEFFPSIPFFNFFQFIANQIIFNRIL